MSKAAKPLTIGLCCAPDENHFRVMANIMQELTKISPKFVYLKMLIVDEIDKMFKQTNGTYRQKVGEI